MNRLRLRDGLTRFAKQNPGDGWGGYPTSVTNLRNGARLPGVAASMTLKRNSNGYTWRGRNLAFRRWNRASGRFLPLAPNRRGIFQRPISHSAGKPEGACRAWTMIHRICGW